MSSWKCSSAAASIDVLVGVILRVIPGYHHWLGACVAALAFFHQDREFEAENYHPRSLLAMFGGSRLVNGGVFGQSTRYPVVVLGLHKRSFPAKGEVFGSTLESNVARH